MAKNTRSKTQIIKDRAQTADLYLKGTRQYEIAEIIGVSKQQISYDIRVMHKQWRSEAMQDIDSLRGREIAKIDKMEFEYWEAWEKSKNETTRVKRTMDASGNVGSQSIERATSFGNPAYMNGIQWCIEQRCKIFGIYTEPLSRIVGITESISDDSHEISAFDLSVLDVAELKNYLSVIRILREKSEKNNEYITVE